YIALIVHVQTRTPDLATEFERVRAFVEGQVIRKMPGSIGATKLRRFTNAAVRESRDIEVRGSEIARIGYSRIETKGRKVLAVIGVVEMLLEEVHAHQQLIDETRGEHRVELQRIIRLPAGNGLEIFFVYRSGERCRFAGAEESAGGKCVLGTERVIDVNDAVIALVFLRVVAEVVRL